MHCIVNALIIFKDGEKHDIYNRLAMLRVAGREIEIFFSLQHKSRPEAFSFPQFFMELFRHQCYNKSAQSFTLFCVQTG